MSTELNKESVTLKGQTAVVTGAGRGIGRAIAHGLAAAGTTVAVLSRTGSELDETVAGIKAAGGRAYSFPADVTDAIAIHRVVEEIEESLGPIDLLVNNAGVLGPIGPFVENDFDEWWHAMDINLRGAVLCAHTVLKKMMTRYRGRIINVSSGGVTAAIAHFSSYITAKTALARFTECLANEVRPFGISIFAISPGTVRTSMSEHSLYSDEGQKWFPWFKQIFEQGLDIPPERPARLVVELASGKADTLSGCFLQPSDNVDAILKNIEAVEYEKLYTLRLRTPASAPNTFASTIASIRASSEAGDGISLRMEQSFLAPRKTVFDLWIDPAAMMKWFTTPGLHQWVEPPILNARPGGKLRLKITKDDLHFDLRGDYIEVKSPERLSFTWRWNQGTPIPGGPGNTIVTLDFEEKDGTTILVLTQKRFPNEAALEAHRIGWQRGFDGIASFLASTM